MRLRAGRAVEPEQVTKTYHPSTGDHFRSVLAELVDPDLAVGETRHDLQLAPHRLNEAAQRPDVHVGALLHLGDGRLVDVEDRRQLCLLYTSDAADE